MAPREQRVDDGTIELALYPWAHPGEAKVYVSPPEERDLRDALTAEGLSNDRVYEFSSGPLLQAVVVAVGTAGAWASLAAAIQSFLQRNKHKAVKVTLRGEPIELNGYSARQVRKLVDEMERLHREADEESQEALGDRRVADPSRSATDGP